jgi:hypothetical protein
MTMMRWTCGAPPAVVPLRALLLAGSLLALPLAPVAARAEQRWQCGDGLSVPLQGTRADREAACRELKEKRDSPPDAAISQEQAERLRHRIEDLEKKYGLEVDVEKLDEK